MGADRTTAERGDVAAKRLARGRFEILCQLGQGAVGDVYEARDTQGGEHVALKLLRDLTPEGLLALKREFRAIQGVHHPNLVRLSELFEEEGRFFFSMELVRGIPFVEYVRGHNDNGPGHHERLRRGLMQLVSGLEALHAAGKVHRDVKSTNALVEADGRTVLLDFGVAADSERAPDDAALLGTVGYMAPEQVTGEQIGPAADFYALGVVLFECLTGQLPFSGPASEVLERKLAEQAPRASALAANVPKDLDDLCEELLRVEPEQRPSASLILARLRVSAVARAAAAAAKEPTFVGRTAELSALCGAWAQTQSAACVALVRGRSGVGKSFLVRHFVQDLERRGEALILRGRCYERESLPYKGVDAVIDGLGDFLARLSAEDLASLSPPDAGLLARVFPVLSATFGSAPLRDIEGVVPEQLRQRTFMALRALMIGVARIKPTVVVIDDVQWSDADSLALLSALLSGPGAPPVLWILLLRTDAEQKVELKLPVELHEVCVDRLAGEDAEALARELLGDAPGDTPARGLAAIVREADGHPLFITELVRSRGHTQRFVSLDEVLWARVQRLPETLRELVEALCVAGAPRPPQVMAHALALSPGALLHASAELESERLLRSENAGGRALLAAYHDRLRESVLAHLGATRSMHWQRRLAESMESVEPHDSDALAYHWEEAGELARAAEYVARAANEAMTQLAFERAAQLFDKQLALQEPTDETRLALERRLAEAWSLAGHGKKAAAVRLRLAEALAPAERVDQRRLAAEDLLTSGRFDEGIRVLRSVIEESGLPYHESPGKALLGLLWRRFQLKLRGMSLAPLAGALELSRCLATDAAWSAGCGLMMVDAIRGNYFAVRNLLSALSLGDPMRALRALAIEAMSGGGADKKRSAALFAAARTLGEKLALPEAQAMLAVTEGGLGYFYGDWLTAVNGLARAEQLFRDHCVGVRFQLNNTRFMLYRSLMACGRLPELSARVAEVQRDAEQREDRYILVNLHSTPLVLLSLAHDQPERAEAELARARGFLTSEGYHVQHYLCMLSRAQILLYRGDAPAALACIEEEQPRLKKALLMRVALIRHYCHDMWGRAALAAARTASGQQRRSLSALAQQASAALRREADPWTRVLAGFIDAGIAELNGQEDQARSLLHGTMVDARTHGMELHVAAAQLRASRYEQAANAMQLARDACDTLARAGVRNREAFVSFLAG
jgi:hypothetical protein